MPLQAQVRVPSSASRFSASSALAGARAPRFAGAAAAGLLASALLPVLGCGSGIISGPPAQGIATPVASAKGPQLGYMWVDTDHTLRPILGVAGSSQMGQSVTPAGTYVGAAASATANIAVLQDADGSFDLMALPSGSPSSLNLTLPAGARIRLSPGATTALIYSPGASAASVVTDLLSAPQVKSISSPGPIADSAVSDSGTVSFAYAQNGSFALAVLSADGRSIPVTTLHASGGLAFLPGKDDLLAADSAANSLTLFRATTGALSAQLIPTSALLKTPSAVGVSGSGRWALVANSASQTLVRIDLNTQAATAVACSCKPTQVMALADEGAFQVTNLTTGPNWLVDAASASPRTLFIPALPAAAKTSLVASAVAP